MGYINKIVSPDVDTFPGAVFEQAGEVPEAQCEEAQIIKGNGSILDGFNTYESIGAYADVDLAGKSVTIAGSLGDDGTYAILSNDDDTLYTDHTFSNDEGNITGTAKDTGQAYLTRNITSFARFIHDAGYAYTIKGGKLYTDCPNVTLADACTNTWNPGE